MVKISQPSLDNEKINLSIVGKASQLKAKVVPINQSETRTLRPRRLAHARTVNHVAEPN